MRHAGSRLIPRAQPRVFDFGFEYEKPSESVSVTGRLHSGSPEAELETGLEAGGAEQAPPVLRLLSESHGSWTSSAATTESRHLR